MHSDLTRLGVVPLNYLFEVEISITDWEGRMNRIRHSNVRKVSALLEYFEVVKHIVPLFTNFKVSSTFETNFDRRLNTSNYFELDNFFASGRRTVLNEIFGSDLLKPIIAILT